MAWAWRAIEPWLPRPESAAEPVLPSTYYVADDVQYFAPGPEWKLAREAAAMRAHEEEQSQRQAETGAGAVDAKRGPDRR